MGKQDRSQPPPRRLAVRCPVGQRNGVLLSLAASLAGAIATVLLLPGQPALAQALTSPSPTPSPSPSATAVMHLSGDSGNVALALVVVLVLLAGVIVIVGRLLLEGTAKARAEETSSQEDQVDLSFIRGWLAVTLVGGLLIFVAVSFWLDDTTLRSTLVGGLVASSGAAVAFYFAGKQTAQAVQNTRRDLLSSLPLTVVPDLKDDKPEEAKEALKKVGLQLRQAPANAGADWTVTSQLPLAGDLATPDRTVTATFVQP